MVLKELRKSRRLTQAQVAIGIKCSTATYNRYENGFREPSMEVLERIADFYGVSMDYLFGRAPLTESALSEDEIALISAFRGVPQAFRDDITDFLRMKAEKKL